MNDETKDTQGKESATGETPRRRPLLRLVSSREPEHEAIAKARLLARRLRTGHDDDPGPGAA